MVTFSGRTREIMEDPPWIALVFVILIWQPLYFVGFELQVFWLAPPYWGSFWGFWALGRALTCIGLYKDITTNLVPEPRYKRGQALGICLATLLPLIGVFVVLLYLLIRLRRSMSER